MPIENDVTINVEGEISENLAERAKSGEKVNYGFILFCQIERALRVSMKSGREFYEQVLNLEAIIEHEADKKFTLEMTAANMEIGHVGKTFAIKNKNPSGQVSAKAAQYDDLYAQYARIKLRPIIALMRRKGYMPSKLITVS